ncbi:hypothetical protein Nepgr_032431 [Nepenthes gracilis]|uniref:Uncharacterized protein n=1 Tax=Nepenthes gracilis TaxID=150966 RepID=A0AAD3TIK8_NEPGR|nr:hypothetical protein Nepgr_032431 [Nepenthes gracilis]
MALAPSLSSPSSSETPNISLESIPSVGGLSCNPCLPPPSNIGIPLSSSSSGAPWCSSVDFLAKSSNASLLPVSDLPPPISASRQPSLKRGGSTAINKSRALPSPALFLDSKSPPFSLFSSSHFKSLVGENFSLSVIPPSGSPCRVSGVDNSPTGSPGQFAQFDLIAPSPIGGASGAALQSSKSSKEELCSGVSQSSRVGIKSPSDALKFEMLGSFITTDAELQADPLAIPLSTSRETLVQSVVQKASIDDTFSLTRSRYGTPANLDEVALLGKLAPSLTSSRFGGLAFFFAGMVFMAGMRFLAGSLDTNGNLVEWVSGQLVDPSLGLHGGWHLDLPSWNARFGRLGRFCSYRHSVGGFWTGMQQCRKCQNGMLVLVKHFAGFFLADYSGKLRVDSIDSRSLSENSIEDRCLNAPSEIAPRSVRVRSLHNQKFEYGQVCAFELLATVAGKLLQESESSSASSSAAAGIDHCSIIRDAIKQETQNVDKPLRTGHDDRGSSEGNAFFSGVHLQSYNWKQNKKEVQGSVTEAVLECPSATAASACSRKTDSDVESVISKIEGEFVKFPSKLECGSPKCGEYYGANIEDGIDRQHKITMGVAGARDSVGFCRKLPALVNSNDNVELPLCTNSIPRASIFSHRDDIMVHGIDNNKILSPFPQTSKMEAIRKPLTSKYWKAAPKLKNSEVTSTAPGNRMKNIYCNKKSHDERERSQHNTPFKKRKLFDQSSVATFDGGISSETASNSPDKGINTNKNGPATKLHAENVLSSSVMNSQKPPRRASNVKFTIKSFKVPELILNVPETATVGSLKRTALDAVTAILGGGLRVGVLLHGKKIRDENRTLLQTGIAHTENLDGFGFMLEPISPAQPSPPICSGGPPDSLTCNSPKNCANRSVVTFNEDLSPLNAPDKSSLVADSGSFQEMLPFPTAELVDKAESNSKALVPVPEISTKPLAVVPVNPRPRCLEMGQRRTRRPFSVSEVEALVQAVEKFGTGRWRDVKLCSFEDAKHRTYVDLKDKWKTLVHTARISPQQRRGEPVPQELLDRVLAAHAYWTQHPANRHGNHRNGTGTLKIADIPVEKAAA